MSNFGFSGAFDKNISRSDSNLFSADNVFLLDPANRAYLDHQTDQPAFVKSLTAGCSGYLLFPLLIVTVLLLGFGLVPLLGPRAAQQFGVSAVATITNLYTTLDAYNDVNGYHVTFDYSPGGQNRYEIDQAINSTLYGTLHTRQPINIHYLSLDPYLASLDNVPPPSVDDLLPSVIIGLTFGLTAGIFLLIGNGLRVAGKHRRRLLNEALPTMKVVHGEVVSCTGRTDSDDDYIIDVTYNYRPTTLSGSVLSGSISKMRNDLKKSQSLPIPGTNLAICYFEQPVSVSGYANNYTPRQDFVL